MPDDQRLARSALEKQRAGRRPNRAELAALGRIQRERDEQLREEHYRTIPKKLWLRWSGKSHKTLDEQAAAYGAPLAGKTIDLAAVVAWLHPFLSKRRHALLAEDDELLLAGGSSPNLERYRLARAKREEFGLERDLGQWLPRDKVHEGLGLFAGVLRQAGETLQRQFGAEAHALLSEAIEDAIGVFEKHFPEHEQAEVPPADEAADTPG